MNDPRVADNETPVVEFHYQVSGHSAGINSAEFYTCSTCGACLVEMHRRDSARQIHTAWHQALACTEGSDS